MCVATVSLCVVVCVASVLLCVAVVTATVSPCIAVLAATALPRVHDAEINRLATDCLLFGKPPSGVSLYELRSALERFTYPFLPL